MLAGLSRDGLPLTHLSRDEMAAILKCIFLNENVWISIQISLNFVPRGSIDKIPALVQIMAPTGRQWRIVYWRIYGSFGLNELIMNLKATACHGNITSNSYGNNKWLLCKTEINVFVQWWGVNTRSRKTNTRTPSWLFSILHICIVDRQTD